MSYISIDVIAYPQVRDILPVTGGFSPQQLAQARRRTTPILPLPRDILQLFHQYLRLKVNRYVSSEEQA
jgi:hypothetical protein